MSVPTKKFQDPDGVEREYVKISEVGYIQKEMQEIALDYHWSHYAATRNPDHLREYLCMAGTLAGDEAQFVLAHLRGVVKFDKDHNEVVKNYIFSRNVIIGKAVHGSKSYAEQIRRDFNLSSGKRAKGTEHNEVRKMQTRVSAGKGVEEDIMKQAADAYRKAGLDPTKFVIESS